MLKAGPDVAWDCNEVLTFNRDHTQLLLVADVIIASCADVLNSTPIGQVKWRFDNL